MKTHSYLTTARLAVVEASLSPRDRLILDDLRRLRLASGAQLRRLHLGDLRERQQRAVLGSLVVRGLTVRLPRAVGGVAAGSHGSVYGLGPAGWRLLADPAARRRPVPEVGALFVAHTLAVSEVYVALRGAERAGHLKLTSWISEPATWRSFSGPGGGRVVLKPDAGTTVQLGDYEDSWYLEIDRATESTSTIARACDRYRAYWQTGREQARTGLFPKVLWLVPDEHRYDQLIGVLGRQPAAAWELFEVALQSDAVKRLAAGVMS